MGVLSGMLKNLLLALSLLLSLPVSSIAQPFGEAAVLDDGRRVITPWLTPGVWVGTTYLEGPTLLAPDATMDTHARVWICGHDATTDMTWVHTPLRWVAVAKGFGRRCIIRPDGETIQVALTTTPYAWVAYRVTEAGVTTLSDQGSIPSGEGAQGMRDWSPTGRPEPMAPLDEVIDGHRVRARVGVENTAIATALFTPDQVVIVRGGALGTLTLGGIDWPTPRLSTSGRYWVGVQYVGRTVRGGEVPAVMPPFVQTTYTPPAQRPFVSLTGWFFSDSVRYGTDTSAPGNATVVVESGLNPSRPVIISRNLIGEYKTRWSKVVGIYVTDEDGSLEMEAGLAGAAMKGYGLAPKPIMSYTSRRVVHAKGVDYEGIEAYVNANETPAQAEKVWRDVAAQAQKPVVVWAGAYDRGFLTDDQMVEGVYRSAEVARDFKAKGLLWFAWGRPTGAKFHPTTADATRKVAASAITPVVTPAPTVTITSYAPQAGVRPLRVRAVALLGGGPAKSLTWRYRLIGAAKWTVAAVNPATDLDHTFTFTRAGTYEIGVDVEGPGGTNGTGLQRLVKVQ